MPDEFVAAIKRRQNSMEKAKEPVIDIYEMISRNMIPQLENTIRWDTYDPYGENYGRHIYDGTGMSAARIQALGLQGYTVNAHFPWFNLGVDIDELADLPEVKEYLETGQKQLLAAFRRSNFYAVLTPLFMQAGTLGTGVIYPELRPDRRLSFRVLHPREFYIQENRYRDVDTIHRRFQLSARNAYTRWGDALSDKVVRAAKDGKNPDQMFEFLHVVAPNDHRTYGNYRSENKPIMSCYMEYDGKELLSKGGFDRMPYMTWRFYLMEDGPYGSAPGWDALFDMMGLNKMGDDLMTVVHKLANPPMVAQKETRGLLDFGPAGISWIDEESQAPTQTQQYPDPRPAFEMQGDIRDTVERHFNVPFFLMLLNRDTEMTAEEVRARLTEKSMLLGPAVGRLQSEVLSEIIDYTWDLLGESGELPELPEAMLEFAGAEIKIEYLSPFTQTQRRLSETQGIDTFMTKMINWGLDPNMVFQEVNPSELIRTIATGESIPQKVMYTREESEQIKQAAAAEQQAAQAAELENMQADTAKKASRAPEPGSPLEEVMSG